MFGGESTWHSQYFPICFAQQAEAKGQEKTLRSQNDGLYPSSYLDKDLEDILSVYGIKKDDFDQVCDDYTNYDLFETDSSGELVRRKDGSPKLKTPFNEYVKD